MDILFTGNFSDFESSGSEKNPKPERKNFKSKTPVLDNFSTDLIDEAANGKLDPVIGREKEIKRLAQILSRRKKNNPILLGEPGCGKTALVEGLAIKINEGDCPRNLLDKKIVSLELSSIVAGTKYRGQFEERMKAIIDELIENPNIIIFIDEIHTVVGTGNSSGSLDAANIFKPALARGTVQCIGATTLNEYREHIEKDGALERRFQKVAVEPTTKEETLQILKNIRDKYETYHKVSFSDEVLELVVMLSERYITDREFPDKAIDIIDEVGSKVQVELKIPKDIEKLKDKLTKLKNRKVDVVKSQKYEVAAELRDQEKETISLLEKRKMEWEEELLVTKKEIKVSDVYEVVSEITKIPVKKLDTKEYKNLIELDKRLKRAVVGQDDAIDNVVKFIKRNTVGIRENYKPIGTFLFLGSTGVGKTHLAKEIAKEVFGTEDSMIRIDMSEYKEKFNSSRLIGSPPGYVGYNEGGQLTEAVRKKPYSLVLLDEIEKAHPDIYDLLLQIFDEGHITDSSGRRINFKNTLIIMTSNVGAKKVSEFSKPLGFNTKDMEERKEQIKNQIIDKSLKNKFKPEFLNRIDYTILFDFLDKKSVSKIIKIELKKLSERLKESDLHIQFDRTVSTYLLNESYDQNFGARPIKRTIQNQIEDLIADEILNQNVVYGANYKCSVKDKTITFNTIDE